MRNRHIYSAGFMILVLMGSWYIAHAIRHPKAPYFQDRLGGILAQADQMPAHGVVVIGDSNTARAYIPTLCGKPALNAGIGWSKATDWENDAAELVRRARPSVVILALGNNDTEDRWQKSYRKLATLASFAVTPKQADKAAFISQLLPTVAIPNARGDTTDSVHLTAKAQREWVRRIEKKCAALGLDA